MVIQPPNMNPEMGCFLILKYIGKGILNALNPYYIVKDAIVCYHFYKSSENNTENEEVTVPSNYNETLLRRPYGGDSSINIADL